VDAGARVALIGRSEASLEEAAASIRARGGIVATAVADVTDIERTRAAVAAVTEQLGPIDVLVNNAGINGPMGPLWETDPAEWWRAVEINFGGAYMLTSAVLPGMVSAGRGRVISITSQAAVHRWPLVSSYAAAKAAVVKLTETLAAELKPHGVSVFSFDPGLLPIGLSEAALASTAGPETAEGQVFGWIKARLAAGQGADPEIAAGWVVNLAAGRGDALSGRHMNVGDDLDDLLARIDDIKRNKLHLLALRKF
jgi:NAD(P)-dependent dehydrogenase (short-subunit alcohol dehydrogenase family)